MQWSGETHDITETRPHSVHKSSARARLVALKARIESGLWDFALDRGPVARNVKIGILLLVVPWFVWFLVQAYRMLFIR